MKKVALIIFILIVLGLLITSLTFLLKANNLQHQLSQSKEMVQRMQEEVRRLDAERQRAVGESERLHTDALSYIALNTKLQKEKERLQGALEEAQKIIQTKEGNLQRLKLNLEQLEKKSATEQSELQEELFKEREELKKRIDLLEGALRKERGLYHYNLGVAYIQAELYDEAVEAYKKSLEFNPDNPEAHYNLGLLYESVRGDKERASLHYHKYLELKPDADDKDEVEAWIERFK